MQEHERRRIRHLGHRQGPHFGVQVHQGMRRGEGEGAQTVWAVRITTQTVWVTVQTVPLPWLMQQWQGGLWEA